MDASGAAARIEEGKGNADLAQGCRHKAALADAKERPVSDAILIYSAIDRASLEKLKGSLAGTPWAAERPLPEGEPGVERAKKR